MIWLGIILAIVLISFSVVLLVGAPYLPTLNRQVRIALELADLKPGETLLELGCGDGKVLIAAARQGLKAVGYELNPLLAALAWLRTRRYGRRVEVKWADFWRADWPEAQAIFVFLLPKYMNRLHKKVIHFNHKPVKLVSFAFEIPGLKPLVKKGGMLLYAYK